MTNPNPMNLLIKFEHQQIVLETLRKENQQLRNTVVRMKEKRTQLKVALKKTE